MEGVAILNEGVQSVRSHQDRVHQSNVITLQAQQSLRYPIRYQVERDSGSKEFITAEPNSFSCSGLH